MISWACRERRVNANEGRSSPLAVPEPELSFQGLTRCRAARYFSQWVGWGLRSPHSVGARTMGSSDQWITSVPRKFWQKLGTVKADNRPTALGLGRRLLRHIRRKLSLLKINSS